MIIFKLKIAVLTTSIACISPWLYGTDTKVSQKLDKTIKRFTDNPAQEALFQVKSGTAKLGKNLAVNPGFEVVWGEPPRQKVPKRFESARGTAWKWSKSSNGVIDLVKHASKDPQFGWRSGRFIKVSGRAYYLAGAIPIKPGHYYMVRVWYRQEKQSMGNVDRKAQVAIKVWWRSKRWIRSDAYRVSQDLTETGEWKLLELVISPPEKAKFACVFLEVMNAVGDTEVWLDNLSLQEIIQNQDKDK